MDAQRSAKFTKFQAFLKAKKWTSVSKFLNETPTGMPDETISSSTSSNIGAAIAHALEFARGVIDAMVGVIDAGAGSAHSAREAGAICAKLLDAGAVSFATGVLRAFCADPRIVGRVATLLRLLCQADGARDVIGEEGAVAALATMWTQHTHCVPLIEALVTLTPSHIDNIWRTMQCGGITTAMRIMESTISGQGQGQYDNASETSSEAAVGRRRQSVRGGKNNYNRTLSLSSSEEKVIDMTTRFIAMCCIYAPDESPAVARKLRLVRKVEIQYLVPHLFQVLQTAVACSLRSIVANVVSALANISECHIREGYGYALGGVEAGDMVNLLLQAWTMFQDDEQLMLVAVWALTAYAAVRDEAMQALRSNCSVEVHALTKPWKGFATVDFLCEQIGPVRPKFSRFNRAGLRTRSKQQTDAVAAEDAEEERDMVALQQQVDMELDEDFTDPEISSPPQDDIEDTGDTQAGQQDVELEDEHNTVRRITRSASQEVDEFEAQGEVEGEAEVDAEDECEAEDDPQAEAAAGDVGVQNSFKRITRSTASQELSEAEDECEAEDDAEDDGAATEDAEHELDAEEEETATCATRIVSTRTTRSSAHAGSVEFEVQEEDGDREECEEPVEILFGEAHWHQDTNNQTEMMTTSEQTAAECDQHERTKTGKRVTRSRASSAGKQLPLREGGRPKGRKNAIKKAASPPLSPDVIVISDEDEEYLVVSPQTNVKSDHDSEMESALPQQGQEQRATAVKARGRRKQQAGGWDNESDELESQAKSQSAASECEEGMEDDDEEALGKRRSARLRHTPKKAPTDFHLGMYGRQGFVSTARAVRLATRADKKMVTRSAPRLSRRRLGESDDVDEQIGDEVECDDNSSIDDSAEDSPASPSPASWVQRGRDRMDNNARTDSLGEQHGRQRRSAPKINELPLSLLEDEDTRTSFDEGAADSAADMSDLATSPTPKSSADGEQTRYRSMRRLSDMMAGLANLDEHALRTYGHREQQQQGGGGIKRKLRWDADADNEDVMMTLRRPVKQARR